jgi:Flp pilus assembly protein TadG
MHRLFRTPVRRLGRRGNAAIEFAILGPVFILVIIAIFEIGAQLMVSAMLDYGMRVSSRWGVTGNAPAGGMTRADYIRSSILSASGGFLQSPRLTLTLQSYGTWGSAGTGTGATAGPGTASSITSYSATYRQPVMTGFASAILGRTYIDHTSTTIVNNEPYPL